MCLTKADPDYFMPKGSLNLVSCFNAVSVGDAREVFYIDLENNIKSFMDGFCLTIGAMPSETKRVWMAECSNSPS
jgi:hypothetical protein